MSLMESLTIKTVLFPIYLSIYLFICLYILIYYLFGVGLALLGFVVHPEEPASDFVHGCPLSLCLSPPWTKHSCPELSWRLSMAGHILCPQGA